MTVRRYAHPMDETGVWTIIISSLALVVSALTFFRSLYKESREGPDVKVSGLVAVGLDSRTPLEPFWGFQIVVTNDGGSAVTIDRPGWDLEIAAGRVNHVSGGAVDDEMPMRLEHHDSKSFLFDIPIRGTQWDGLTGRPVVSFVKRPTWREKRRGLTSRRTARGSAQVLRIPPDWS